MEDQRLVGRRILVVGINYAPEPTGIAPYTTQACEAFAAAGADVLAIAGVPHYPHWSTPRAYRRRLRWDERRGGVAVRRLRHTVPTRQSALSRGLYEATFGLRVLGQRLPRRPDVVIAVTPSLLGAAAASFLARKAKAPLVLWVQDLMGPASAQSGISGGGRVARATTAIERWTVRRAHRVVAVSPAFEDYLLAAGLPPDRVELVPNWTHVDPPSQDRDATRRRLGWLDGDVVALHSGNMGLKQGLENLVAAGRLAGPPLRVVVMGDGSQQALVAAAAAHVDRLQVLPLAAPDEYAAVLSAADVLLVNERATAVDMSLPSKLTSYFNAARPVVAAVPPDGGTAAEVRRSGGGVLVPPEDPAALVAALTELAADPATRDRLAVAGVEHARRHLGSAAALRRLCDVVGSVSAG